MEIWSSGSDDEEAAKPTHGCFMAKTASPTQTKLDEVLSILKSFNIKSDKCETLINALKSECQETELRIQRFLREADRSDDEIGKLRSRVD